MPRVTDERCATQKWDEQKGKEWIMRVSVVMHADNTINKSIGKCKELNVSCFFFFLMIASRDHGFIFNKAEMSVWVSKCCFAHRKNVNIIALSQSTFLTIYIGCRIMYRFSMAIQTQPSFIITFFFFGVFLLRYLRKPQTITQSAAFFFLLTFITHAVLDRRKEKKNEHG